jgi:hypothetical protein
MILENEKLAAVDIQPAICRSTEMASSDSYKIYWLEMDKQYTILLKIIT